MKLYLLNIRDSDCFKVGIAANVVNRVKSLGASRFDLDNSYVFESESVSTVKLLERQILEFFSDEKGTLSEPLHSGNTEILRTNCFRDVLDEIERVMRRFPNKGLNMRKGIVFPVKHIKRRISPSKHETVSCLPSDENLNRYPKNMWKHYQIHAFRYNNSSLEFPIVRLPGSRWLKELFSKYPERLKLFKIELGEDRVPSFREPFGYRTPLWEFELWISGFKKKDMKFDSDPEGGGGVLYDSGLNCRLFANSFIEKYDNDDLCIVYSCQRHEKRKPVIKACRFFKKFLLELCARHKVFVINKQRKDRCN